ncbi:MAG: hypothetical protein ACOY82_14590 [Pseudomonadota bacterium]
MSFFIAPPFRDLDLQQATVGADGYGLRYGRAARARREAAFPHFGVHAAAEAPPRALPAVCFVEGRAC